MHGQYRSYKQQLPQLNLYFTRALNLNHKTINYSQNDLFYTPDSVCISALVFSNHKLKKSSFNPFVKLLLEIPTTACFM